MPDLPDLKPCPHCGAPAWVRFEPAWFPGVWEVRCSKCPCGLGFFGTYIEAVVAWDGRVKPRAEKVAT